MKKETIVFRFLLPLSRLLETDSKRELMKYMQDFDTTLDNTKPEDRHVTVNTPDGDLTNVTATHDETHKKAFHAMIGLINVCGVYVKQGLCSSEGEMHGYPSGEISCKLSNDRDKPIITIRYETE